MSKIENIEKTFTEIARALAGNEKICRLLYIDKPDALTTNQFTQPSIEFLFENKKRGEGMTDNPISTPPLICCFNYFLNIKQV